MKSIYLLLLILTVPALQGCQSQSAAEGNASNASSLSAAAPKTASPATSIPAEEEVSSGDEVAYPEPVDQEDELIPQEPADAEEDAKKKLTGTYSSKRGVMHRISCFCFNGGYLTLDNGDEVAVCFKDDNLDVDCERIEIKGNYKTIRITPAKGEVCTSGEMTVFEASSFKCK